MTRDNSTPSTLCQGELVDHYEVQECLGQGSFGAVYKVEDVAAPAGVRPLFYALKLLDRHFDASDINEVRALYELRHPNIVSMVRVGEHQGSIYIVLELLHGCSLAQHLKEVGPLGWQAALALMESIVGALGYAHERGINHGDLHPGNVFLQSDGPAKVLDFGLAYVARETPFAVPRGAPGFMAPEVPHRETLSDIFSAGIVLYTAIRGGLPARIAHFKGRTLVPANVALPTESEISALDAPRALRHAIAVATRRNPEQRPRTMGEWHGLLMRARGPWARTSEAVWSAPPVVWGSLSLLAFLATLIFLGTRLMALQAKVDQVASALGVGGRVLGNETWTVKLRQIGPLTIEAERSVVAPLTTFTDRVGAVSFEMVSVPGPGQAKLAVAEPASGPQALSVSKYEVTRRLWREIAETALDHREIVTSPAGEGDYLPVTNVSLLDVREFLARLRRETGRAYRLPTSAEWTYIADAGAGAPYPFGEVISPEYANFDCTAPLPVLRACPASLGAPRPVGYYGVANAFGVFDTVGNVWELAVTPANQVRIHGGAYSHGAHSVRTNSSKAHDADQSAPDVGFRIVLGPDILQSLLSAGDDDREAYARDAGPPGLGPTPNADPAGD